MFIEKLMIVLDHGSGGGLDFGRARGSVPEEEETLLGKPS
jgi:hypothetical protein